MEPIEQGSVCMILPLGRDGHVSILARWYVLLVVSDNGTLFLCCAIWWLTSNAHGCMPCIRELFDEPA